MTALELWVRAVEALRSPSQLPLSMGREAHRDIADPDRGGNMEPAEVTRARYRPDRITTLSALHPTRRAR